MLILGGAFFLIDASNVQEAKVMGKRLRMKLGENCPKLGEFCPKLFLSANTEGVSKQLF